MLSPGPTHVVLRDNFCPSGLFELTRRPSGQKLSLVTTRVGPGDNKDSYPPLGQQFPTFGTKKIPTLPRDQNQNLRDHKKFLYPPLGQTLQNFDSL